MVDKLILSEEHYRMLVETMSDGLGVQDENGLIIYVNDKLCDILGYSRDEIIGHPVVDFLDEANRRILKVQMERRRRGEREAYEITWTRKDGRKIVTIMSPSPILDAEGHFKGSFAVITDISERKQIGAVLRKNEQQLSLIYDSVDDILYYLAVEPDDCFRFLSINQSFLDVTGLTEEQIVGKRIEEVIPELSVGMVRDNYKKAIKENRIVRWEEISVYPVGTKVGDVSIAPVLNEEGICTHLVGTVHDITERKRLESVLQKRTSELGERVKELNCLYNISNLVETPGISLEEILQGTVNLIPPSWQHPNITCARIILEGQEFRTDNFRETVWKQVNSIVVHSEQLGTVEVSSLEARPESNEGFFLKEERSLLNAVAEQLGRIIERKRVEEVLKIKDSAIASSINAIAIADLEGRLTYINKSFLEMWGYDDEEEVLGEHSTEFWQVTKEAAQIVKALSDRENWVGELVAQRKDGSTFNTQLSANMVTDKAGKPICMMASFVNITERKQMEKELHQSQTQLFQTSKLATLGEMATGLAHEINQPLGGISLSAQYLRKLMERDKLSPQAIESVLDDIESSVKRMSSIINHIRAFARQGTSEFTQVDINETIVAALSLLGEQLRLHQIEVVQYLGDGLPPIAGEPYQLEQVWINLITNARDAMDDKGDEVADRDYKKSVNITTAYNQESRFVEISIGDNGIGMSEEVRAKVFDPFFTTKEVGKGTGLGLSICYGIIESHKGHIEVESKEGEGTIFKVILPLEVDDDQDTDY